MSAGTLMHPGRHPARIRVRPRSRAYLQPAATAQPIAGYGAPGAATFVLQLQDGVKVTFTWSTTIIKSYSGNEQRESLNTLPKQRFEGSALVLDGDDRIVKAALMRSAAKGSTFLLALPYEELVLSRDASGCTVFVDDQLALCDWATPGQRVTIVADDCPAQLAVVQAAVADTIVLDVSPGSAGRTNARIMPLVQILLDPQQGFARYPVTADTWSVRATAAVFGWAGQDAMGLGSSITTYTAGTPIALTSLIENDLLIWDKPNEVDGTAQDSMLSLAETIDLGGSPTGIGGADVPDWSRTIKFSSSSRADWQWLKAFMRQVRGRQRSFLLSTNRDDLIYVASVVGGIMVASSAIAGGGDYVAWFASHAHRRLAATTAAGDAQYVTVTAVVDNLDGTLSLSLDSSVIGVITRISLLEQVRLDGSGGGGDSDDLEVTWSGSTFTVELAARAVQDVIVPQSLRLFDKIVAFAASPPPGPPHPPEQMFSVDLGVTTLINFTSDRTLTFGGISTNGGNVDGMVVCLSNQNTTSAGLALTHEDMTWPAECRLLNAGLSTVIGVARPAWYRYNGALQRWVQIA